MVNDKISDFLARIRNAQERKREEVTLPSSKMLVAIADILKKEGFIEDYEVIENGKFQDLLVKLKYVKGVPAIRDLVRVSKPGIRKYRGYQDIKPVMNGLGVALFSTPQGILTGEEAKKRKVGGEFLCYVY